MSLKIFYTICFFTIFTFILSGCSGTRENDVDSTLEILDDIQYYDNLEKTIYNKEKANIIKIKDFSITIDKNFYIIEEKNREMKIEKKEFDKGIISISFSENQNYLAIEICLHEGISTYIIDLNAWICWSIDNSEVVFNPNWSPNNKNILVVGIGSISNTYPYIYDVETKKIKKIVPNKYMYSMDYVDGKWSKDGNFIDFIFEEFSNENSNSFVLYRYELTKNKFYKICNITRDQFLNWSLRYYK